MAESRLPHYRNSTVSMNKYEPLHPNLYKVVLNLPKKLQEVHGSFLEIMHEHINTIGGLQAVNPALDVVEQKYQWATRSFAGMPSTTAIDITMEFSLNLNDANQAYTYKILRDWYRLAYDPDTGYAGLKKDYVADVIEILQHNRTGEVYRRIKLYDVFLTTAPEAMDSLDYSSADPFVASCTFRCDYYEEELA